MKDKISRFIGKPVKEMVVVNKRITKSYKVDCEDGTTYRYDDKYPSCYNQLQLMAWDRGINVPRVLKRVGKERLSEWIEGVELISVWHIDEAIIAAGEVMAQINNVQCGWTEWWLINTDINRRNFIWTADKEIYMIDWNHSRLVPTKEESNRIAAASTMKRMQDRDKIELFLRGYKKHRDIKEIRKILECFDYQWNDWCKKYSKNTYEAK